MMGARNFLRRSALAGLVLSSGGVAWLSLRSSTATAAPTVRTATVVEGSIQSSTAAAGNVQAASALSLGFETAGKVKEVLVKVGDTVAPGAVLARLDPADANKAITDATTALTRASDKLDAAEAAQNMAVSNLVNAQNAPLGGAATSTAADAATSAQGAADQAQTKYDQAVTGVETAQANVDASTDKLATARAALTKETLTAPTGGTITAGSIVVGQSVTASGISAAATSTSSASTAGTSGTGSSGAGSGGTFTLTDLSTLQVKASVAEADTAKVKVGQAASISFDALTDTKLAGRVLSIGVTSTVTNNVVSYEVVVSLVNPPASVRSGMTAAATIVTASRDGVLRLPTAAVRGTGSSGSVTVVDGNGVQSARRVVLGMKGDDATEIVSGLAVGDRAVTATLAAAANGSTAQGGTGTRTPTGSGANRLGAGTGGGAGLPGGGVPVGRAPAGGAPAGFGG